MQSDNFLEGFEVGEKGFFSQGGDFVGRDRFSSGEAFMDPDILHVFQRFQVAGQVTVGQFEGTLQIVEGHPVVDRQDGHDAQPDFAVEGFIELSDDIFHLPEFLGSRSWAKYI